MKKVIAIILALGLASLMYWSFFWRDTGLEQLKALCEKDAGLFIYKTVEADGFYNSYSNNGITNYLIKGPYSFYEFCDDSPSTLRDNIFPDPGCFRVKKVYRESSICNERVDKNYARFVVEPYPEFMKTFCIAVEKIEKPTARYSYHSQPSSWSGIKGAEFRRSDSFIRDTQTSQIVGRYVSYSYNANPGISSPQSCHNINKSYISYREANLIGSIIKPHKLHNQ
jgi:hypothetical protein